MIRGGGLGACRSLDLADEAKIEGPLCLSLPPSLSSSLLAAFRSYPFFFTARSLFFLLPLFLHIPDKSCRSDSSRVYPQLVTCHNARFCYSPEFIFQVCERYTNKLAIDGKKNVERKLDKRINFLHTRTVNIKGNFRSTPFEPEALRRGVRMLSAPVNG